MGLLDKKVQDIESEDFDDSYDDSKEFDETYDDYKTSNSGEAELSKILIETETFINSLKLTLENKYIIKKRVVDEEGNDRYQKIPTQVKGSEPLLNGKGINQVIGRVRSLITHVTGLANINEEKYKLFAGRFIKDLARTLIIHCDEYDLKKENIRDVRRLITDPVLLFLTRPMNDKERAYNFGKDNKDDTKSNGVMADIIDWNNKRKGLK